MTEIVLVLSNLLFGISILTYFYFREIKNQDRDFEKFRNLNNFLVEAVNNLKESSEGSLKTLTDITKSKDNLTQKALLEYLKHNERLEKMILPQPVTRKAVQEILDQTPPIVPNDIDKTDTELQSDELNELLTRIPINKNTKVKFEDDVDLPEEIDEGVYSGKLN